YSGYFGMSSSALAQESEFEVSEDATKTQIKSAFVKSLKTKKLNKKILGEFVELISLTLLKPSQGGTTATFFIATITSVKQNYLTKLCLAKLL
ncbi:hypothetical protein MUO66_02750, partial [Candidatus Bathyarchaeota archaeon]|nr:hypothetical protein [Candidatus Bathyarchaeota archaeon]